MRTKVEQVTVQDVSKMAKPSVVYTLVPLKGGWCQLRASRAPLKPRVSRSAYTQLEEFLDWETVVPGCTIDSIFSTREKRVILKQTRWDGGHLLATIQAAAAATALCLLRPLSVETRDFIYGSRKQPLALTREQAEAILAKRAAPIRKPKPAQHRTQDIANALYPAMGIAIR